MRTLTTRTDIRWAALTGLAGLAILVAACSTGGTGAGLYGGSASTAASPAAVASVAPASAAAAAPSAAASASGGGRYGGGSDDYGSPASGAPAASGAAGGGAGALKLAVASGAVGSFLTGDGGRTLYIFKKDSPGKSACGPDCATNWPPLTVKDAAAVSAGDGVTGKLSTFTRDDGSLQVAYDGAPLYYFAADTAAGDTNGQGIGGNWFVAAP